MKITRGFSTNKDRNVFDPLLEEQWSFFFELRGGDVLRPLNGKWFGPEWPTKISRWFCKWNILPFIAWRLDKRGGYFGFKAFVADGELYPAYYNWMDNNDTGKGSMALCPSFRPFADMVKQ